MNKVRFSFNFNYALWMLLGSLLFVSQLAMAQGNSGNQGNQGGGNQGGGGFTLGVPGATEPSRYYFSGNLSFPSGTQIVGPVEIVVDGNISLSGNDTVSIATGGSLKLYIEGNITASGNAGFNNANRPEAFQVFGLAEANQTQSIAMNGNGFISAFVYAPQAAVTSNGGGNNGGFAGAIIGKSITIHGSPGPFYYDETLKELFEDYNRYSLEYYRLVEKVVEASEFAGGDQNNGTFRDFMDGFFD